jgi:hypothetical protein
MVSMVSSKYAYSTNQELLYIIIISKESLLSPAKLCVAAYLFHFLTTVT